MKTKKRRINITIKAFALILTLISIFSLLGLPVFAEDSQDEVGKTVKVGYMLVTGFEEIQEVKQGDKTIILRSGYGYEYLQMIRNYTGWSYEYEEGTWKGLLDKLERGELDLLSHVAKTPLREKKLLFSDEPQGYETHYLYVDGDNSSIDPDDYTTLNGKSIGVISGDFRTELFLEWCEKHKITCYIKKYDDIQKIHEAIHAGEIHATSASRLTISSCKDAKWRSIIRFDDTPVFFAVKRGAEGEQLLAELNEAHSQILALNPRYGEELQQKYETSYTTETPKLTEEELNWLTARGTLNVGYCDDRRPLAYTNENGKLAGLLADYLSAMTKEYGINFNTKSYKTGTELLAALQSGEVDLISPVGYNSAMAEVYNLAITNPLTTENMVAVFKGYKGTENKDIFPKIAVLRNSITEKDYAKRNYPDAEWVLADTVGEAIDLVAHDEASCYLIRTSTWSWYKNEYSALNDLQVLTLPNPNDVNMAIKNEDIQLLSILNKGISLLTKHDINQSIVAHSDASGDPTLFSLIKANPLSAAVTIIALVLFVVLIFVLFRLKTEKKYGQKLELAHASAEEARREAERANLAKSTFLTSMSHDIRTPMNAIIGMTTLATKHISNEDYVKNCLGKVTLASDHLLTLINDVLDINKIESGNLALTPTVFSLADSITNLANIGRHQLRDKDHLFEIRIHNIKYEYLFADELRINQIFINLLSNAVKYTPTGGKITIDIKQEHIHGERGKTRLVYIIEDNGIGMSDEFQKHMYELFAMANKTGRTVTGSGVGLSICKQLIDLMGGTIECESAVNKGTKFTVKLDLPIADKLADELMLPPMKLLLVDDDEVFLATASETLRELGLSPDCVDSGEKALHQVVKKHHEGKDYPLIIIDWKMPDMDGIETTRRIRAEVGDDVSIIVISAYAPEDIRDAALSAGANGFIAKPFFRATAYQSITEILGLNQDIESNAPEHHQKVRGMNVLVAEDNDLNWEITRELLAMYDVKADRAENGQMCLDMLTSSKKAHYDMVLMDIQMPIMNGYQASRKIRESERPDISGIPIIAMTADAYKEDVLLSIEAGMNSHIAKPVDMEKLLEAMAKLRTE